MKPDLSGSVQRPQDAACILAAGIEGNKSPGGTRGKIAAPAKLGLRTAEAGFSSDPPRCVPPLR